MASPSHGDTSMADYSMASISMGGAGSSDDNRSNRSDNSNTQVVKVEKKKLTKPGSSTMPGSYKVNHLGKLEEVEGDEEDGVQI